MRRDRLTVTGVFWLQLAVCIFLITLGIIGLADGSPAFRRSGAFFRGGGFNMVASVMELVGGGILLVTLFAGLRGRAFFWVGVVLFALWLMLILEAFFMRGLLEPNVLAWLNALSWHVVVAVVLWIVARQHR